MMLPLNLYPKVQKLICMNYSFYLWIPTLPSIAISPLHTLTHLILTTLHPIFQMRKIEVQNG